MAMMYALYRFWLCVLWIAPSLWTVVASESGNSTIATMHQSSLTVTSKSMIASVPKSSSLPSVSISPKKTSKMSFHSTTVSPNKTSPISATTSHTVTLSFNSTVLPSGSVTTSPSQSKTVMPSYNTTVMPTSHVITPSFNSTVLPSGSVTTSPSQSKFVMPSYNTTVMPTSHVITPSFNSTVLPSGSVTTSASQNGTVIPSYNTTVRTTQSIMPSSPHSVVPTSTVHPMPPAPHPGNFSVKGKNGKVCLVADMAATFDVEAKPKKMTILLPTNATASGECDENQNEPYIILGWNSKEGSYNFTMYFHKFGKERWSAANLTFSLKTAVGSNEAAPYTFSSKGKLNQLSAKVGYSYQCLTSTINFNLTGGNGSSVKVSMDQIEIQPYEVKNGKLGEAEKCGAHPTSKPTTSKPRSHAVAIAVGCSLAGLVVIVVIGYLIGRRRSRNVAEGYRKL